MYKLGGTRSWPIPLLDFSLSRRNRCLPFALQSSNFAKLYFTDPRKIVLINQFTELRAASNFLWTANACNKWHEVYERSCNCSSTELCISKKTSQKFIEILKNFNKYDSRSTIKWGQEMRQDPSPWCCKLDLTRSKPCILDIPSREGYRSFLWWSAFPRNAWQHEIFRAKLAGPAQIISIIWDRSRTWPYFFSETLRRLFVAIVLVISRFLLSASLEVTVSTEARYFRCCSVL